MNFLNVLNSYDYTSDLSNAQLPETMMNEIKSAYLSLKNENGNDDYKIIKKLDDFREAMIDEGMESRIPAYLKNKNKVDLQKISFLKKMVSLKIMIKKIEKDLEKEFSDIDIKFGNNITFSSNGKIDIIVDETSNRNRDRVINLDIRELSKKPGLETYFRLKSKINDVVYNIKSGEKESEFGGAASSNSLNATNAKDKLNNTKERARFILETYLEGYLKRAFGSEFKNGNTHNIASLTASELISTIEETGELGGKKLDVADLDTFLEGMFSKEFIDQAANAYVEDFLDTFTEDRVVSARTGFLKTRADELLASGASHAEALNFQQIAQNLMSDDANYKNAKNCGFDKFAGKTLNQIPRENIKALCEDYAKTFMNGHGLKTIPIIFESISSKGEFNDNAQIEKVCIKINLNKNKSLTDLYMTLSHELTHAADSALNKYNDKFNSFGGGLLNDISEDISGIAKNSKAYGVLKELKDYCYKLNPNERKARMHELSALIYASSVNQKIGGSNVITADVKKYTERFINYQKETIKTAEKVEEYLKTVKIPAGASEKAANLIQERINYLNNIIISMKTKDKTIDGLNVDLEQKSIKMAESLKKGEIVNFLQNDDNEGITKRKIMEQKLSQEAEALMSARQM